MLKHTRFLTPLVAALASMTAGPSTAQSAGAGQEVLRICASAIEAPFSYRDGSGFENRIAEAVAEAMGRRPEFVWTDRAAIYLVRDLLDKHECDVVTGLDTGDPRVLTTRPYYRSGYVFVTRADREIEIDRWDDRELASMRQIALGFGSAAEAMMRRIGKYEDNSNYVFSLVEFKSRRNQYVRVDPGLMVNEVAQGNADAAIAFGPEVARYVKASVVPLRMQFLPADDTGQGEPIVFEYDQSMAVRKDDPELLDLLDDALERAAPRIRDILEQEGVPVLPAPN